MCNKAKPITIKINFCSNTVFHYALQMSAVVYTKASIFHFFLCLTLQCDVKCRLILINSDWSPGLESLFNAGPVAFWLSKWTNEIWDTVFLVPVSGVWWAKFGHKFLVTVSGSRNLGWELGSCAVHLMTSIQCIAAEMFTLPYQTSQIDILLDLDKLWFNTVKCMNFCKIWCWSN